MSSTTIQHRYRLYYAPGAASLLVHWLLIEVGAAHELAKVDMDAGEHKKPEFLALNPSGLIPTMLIDGVPHHEAAALALHLADAFPAAHLAPAAHDAKRAQLYQWMFNLANAVQPLLRAWWRPEEWAGEPHSALVREHLNERIDAQWTRIDAHLAEHGALLGEKITVADFYLVMLMRWSRNMPRPATNWPNLAALAARLKQLPSFKTLYEREGLTEWA